MLLIYSSIIIPVQLCLWNYDDPCIMFPTLYFDVIVDSFFLVRPLSPIAVCGPQQMPNFREEKFRQTLHVPNFALTFVEAG